LNSLDDVRKWDEEVRHLVQAHGAEPGRLIGYALPLNQLQWVHFDTHTALDIVQVRPPDGHIHRVLVDPGRPDQPQSSYRPFLASPTGRNGHALTALARFAVPSMYTGLPQTEMAPDCDPDGDVTGRWAELAIVELSAHLQGLASEDTSQRHGLALPWWWGDRFGELGKQETDQVVAKYRAELRGTAAAAAAHWSASASFRAVAARPGTTPAPSPPREADWEAGQ